MSTRVWNAAFLVAVVAYLVVGTALLGKAMNAEGGATWLLIAGAQALLFAAAFACPGWWALTLPFVTFVPVAVWGTAECDPGFLDFCDLVWIGAGFVAIVGLPVAAIGTWLGHQFRPRSVEPYE